MSRIISPLSKKISQLTVEEVNLGITKYLENWRAAELEYPTFNNYLLKNITFEGSKKENADQFTIQFSFKVQPEYTNSFGTLHGGVIASLIDILSSFPIAVFDFENRGGVSTDINVTYMNASLSGDVVLIETQCLKSGKFMAFSHTKLFDKNSGKILAMGSHTKFLETKRELVKNSKL